MIYNNVLEIIGNTPMVKYLDNICLKLEYYNPSNSVKDRASYSMIKNALERGEINKDTVIIEPTSGNTGIGLSMCAAVLGMKIIICMPESMSIERRKTMTAYGAELVLTPKEEGMKGAVDKALELKSKYPNSFIPMQFANPDNPKAHQQTANEIKKDAEGKEVVVVAGIGTGGTACGIKKYFPEALVFGVEPAESPLFTAGKAGPHKIQGIGANFIPDICKDNNLDGIVTVKGDDAIETAKELAQKHGIFCGISAGANLFASKEIAKKYPDKLIVSIVPDSGERYLSVF
ncbi:cysteine synthase A [bacterium]|nr:cysteine synthase A [bacterium]